MKYYFTLLVLLYCIDACAQNGYSIYYSNQNAVGAPASRLVFNDSVSYWYPFIPGHDHYEHDSILGNSVEHHAMYNIRNDSAYSVIALQKKFQRLYPFSKPVLNWIYKKESVQFLGHSCKEAYSIGSSGDILFVLFAEDIPLPYGPLTYYDLPGVVLEVYDQQLNRYWIATKIETGNFKIVIPGLKKLSKEEWRRYVRREKM
jgi:GLPGLI family protein